MADPAPTSTSSGPKSAYQEAIRQVDTAMQYMTETADDWLQRTNRSIDSLGTWTPPDEATPPDLRPQPVLPGTLPNLPAPDPNLFGDVGELQMPAYDDLVRLIESFEPDDPGPFNPQTGLPQIPPAPTPITTGDAPVRPELNPVAVPTAPNLTLPTPEALEELTLPAMPAINIPALDIAEVPTFDVGAPDLSFNWTEQTYTPLALNELSATIKAMLAGGFAMPAAVQEALWGAAVEREDITARKAVADAFDDWASRGFSMPPGMLVEQVNAVREQSVLAANGHSRGVFAQAAQWAIENLRTAVAQGIALESLWSQHWNQTAQRAFEAAKTLLDVIKDQFNLRAQAFNLSLQSISAKRDVFESRMRAEMAKLDILRAQIEAEQLKGTINEQRVRIYTSRLEAVKVVADLFSTQLEGAKIHSDLERSKIDAYKTDVDAWAARLQADKVRFEAYDSQVRAEGTKAQVYEAEARAYAATVSAASDRNNARLRLVESKLNATDASVRKFLGLLQAQTAVLAARRDAISARAQAYAADTARLAEQMRYAGQGEELKIRALEATVRNQLAYFDALSRQYDGRMQRLLQASLALRESMSAAGQMSAQMAAGALSAIHASASISGSGSESSSQSRSESFSYSGEIADAPVS